jgi:ADP-heptose:LPS heptosyltransferase
LFEALAEITGIRLLRVSGDVSTLDELAARIAALDLVISEGGLTAHLAGALGVPSWLLLPTYAEWHWLGDEEKSAWYPSVRLFRQRRPNDWTAPIERLRAELLNFIAENADQNRMRPISGPHWAFGPLVPPVPSHRRPGT